MKERYTESAPLTEFLPGSGSTRQQLLERCLSRYARVDPVLHAFVPDTVQPEVVRTEHRRAIGAGGALAGVPFAVKDIIAVDGLPRSGGSALPAQALAGAESSVVRQLRRAGAVPFGVSVSTEFAWFKPGATRNPVDIRHTPGGSSSGSAAAVAAGIVPLAIGTQTIGSVIRPASFCGVVGYKPSQGLLPRDGILSVSTTMDHPGFFTQDLAGMIEVARVSGLIPNDAESRLPPLILCTGAYLKQADSLTVSLFTKIADELSAAGFVVKQEDPFHDDEIHRISAAHRTICAREFHHAHSTLFGSYGKLYSPTSEAFFREGSQVTAGVYFQALEMREQWLARFGACTPGQTPGAIYLSPAAVGLAPVGLETTGDPTMNLPWTFLGAPALSLPLSDDLRGGKLPMGLQLTTARFGDGALLHAAATLQEAEVSQWLFAR